jgi:dTDP-4-amino-4,6-dideoxygalactose transaminase
VFCDINIEDYTIDVNKIEELITENTSAIVPVHVYGNICDVEKINDIAQKYKLKVIYDAAHAFGVQIKGQGIGNFGDASMFSFHATKVFNTIEGGAVTFKNQKLHRKLYNLKNFGIESPDEVCDVGANAKMNEFQAAMGLCNLRHIENEIKKRKNVTDRYKDHLSGIKGVKICDEAQGIKSNYAYFPILFDESIFGKTRDQVSHLLEKEQIYARKYFYPLTKDYACYKKIFNSCLTPVANYVAARIITLPLYGELPIEHVDKICDIIINE